MTTGGMREVEPGDHEWPSQLDDLGDGTPKRLWVNGSGDLRLLALRSVAIVGARSATPYGMTVASELAAALTTAGWVVISGAAFGIDSGAHRGAMTAAGCTIAVVAGGADVPSPAAHAGLLDRVREHGVLVSEQPPGSHPRRFTFLQRNRIIAALSRAVVVVEAGSRSGALNTARWAESINRCVMATPGPVTSSASRGVHALIRDQRAILVDRSEHVLEVLEPVGALIDIPDRGV